MIPSYPFRWPQLLGVVGFFILGSIVGGAVLLGITQFVPALEDVAMPLSYFISFALPIHYAWRKAGRPALPRVNLRQLPSTPILLGTVACMTVASFGFGLMAGYAPTHDLMQESMDSLGEGLGAALAIMVLAPVMEEWLFRGLMLDRLLQWRSEWAAVLISSALFGAIHFVPIHAVGAAIIGLMLGLVYVRTRSLMLVIGLHFFNNAMAFVARRFDAGGADEVFGMAGDLALGGAMLVGGIWLLTRLLPKSTTASPKLASEPAGEPSLSEAA